MNNFLFQLVQRKEVMLNGERQINLVFIPDLSEKILSAGGKIVFSFSTDNFKALCKESNCEFIVGTRFNVALGEKLQLKEIAQ